MKAFEESAKEVKKNQPNPDRDLSVPTAVMPTPATPMETSVRELTEKNATLLAIFDASSSGTNEGVQFVKPYLLSPDAEVRRAAVEAMKQLSLPSAAKVLREAAERSSSPSDKAELMKAADFVELPPYTPRKQTTNR
jgi:hypothetical protein